MIIKKNYQIGDTFIDTITKENIIVVKDNKNLKSQCDPCYYLSNGQNDKDDSNCYDGNCSEGHFHFEINTK